MAGDKKSEESQQQNDRVQGIRSPIKTELQWPDISQIPKLRGGKPVNSRRPFLRDTKQYIKLLKHLRREYPSGEIKVLPKATAKHIASESRLFTRTKDLSVQKMATLLSEDVESNFIKINKDIGLIEEGREEEILPFQGVEEFQARMNLRKVFESLTKPGTVIRRLADYKKDVRFLNINAVGEKLLIVYHKKLTLCSLAVLYRRNKYIDNAKDVFFELKAYGRLYEKLKNNSVPPLDVFRTSRDQLVQEYDFEKMYDESYKPSTAFERCLLGEPSQNSEVEAHSSLRKETSGDCQNDQSQETKRQQESFKRGKKTPENLDEDWQPLTKQHRTDDFETEGVVTRARKVKEDNKKPSKTAGETEANKNCEETESNEEEEESSDQSFRLKIDPLPSSNTNEDDLDFDDESLNSDGKSSNVEIQNSSETSDDIQSESICIVCNKEKAEKPSLYCSQGCIYFSLLRDANEEKLTEKQNISESIIICKAGSSKDLNNAEHNVEKTNKVTDEQPLQILAVPSGDGSGSFKLVIDNNGLHEQLNVNFLFADRTENSKIKD